MAVKLDISSVYSSRADSLNVFSITNGRVFQWYYRYGLLLYKGMVWQ